MLEGLIANWEYAAGALLILTGTSCELWLLRNVLMARRRNACSNFVGLSHARDVLPCNRDDCDFGLLWESQKEVLEALYEAGDLGLSLTDLTDRYKHLAFRYPELCDGIPFSEWLLWMRETKLVSCNDDRATITEKGQFLLYDLDCNRAFADHRCV